MITNYDEGFTLLFYFFCSEIYSFSANDRVHRRWRNEARVSKNWQVSYSQGFSDKRESRVTAMRCCSFLHCVVRYFYLHREFIFHRLLHDVVCVNWGSLEPWQTLHLYPDIHDMLNFFRLKYKIDFLTIFWISFKSFNFIFGHLSYLSFKFI